MGHKSKRVAILHLVQNAANPNIDKVIVVYPESRTAADAQHCAPVQGHAPGSCSRSHGIALTHHQIYHPRGLLPSVMAALPVFHTAGVVLTTQ